MRSKLLNTLIWAAVFPQKTKNAKKYAPIELYIELSFFKSYGNLKKFFEQPYPSFAFRAQNSKKIECNNS